MSDTIAPDIAGQHHRDRAFLGHPRGLGYLAFCEGWERFSYYGMQALLVLYMTRQLLLPGHVEHVAGFAPLARFLGRAEGATSPVALASAVFGLYAGFVYMTPVLGGIVADRLLGRTRTVTIGALLMAAGHFLMAFEQSFLLALLCLLIGVGCFKGNIAAQVGELYAPGDLRRADAFQIFLLAINVAVILAPLVCGTLGEKAGFHWGFGAAGVGMLLGLFTYLAGRRWLPPEPPPRRAGTPPPKLTAREWRTITILVLLLPVLMLGAVGNQQIFNAYILWGERTYDLVFFGRTMPVTWLLSLDAFVGAGTIILTVAFWRWWATFRREPDEVVKCAIGMTISAGGALVLAIASWMATGGHKIGLGWGLAFHVVNDIGYSNLFPVGLALYSRAAPPRIAATMVSIYYLHLFAANLFVGWLGGLIEKMPGTSFWLLHAGLVLAAALVMILFARVFGRALAPGTEADR